MYPMMSLPRDHILSCFRLLHLRQTKHVYWPQNERKPPTIMVKTAKFGAMFDGNAVTTTRRFLVAVGRDALTGGFANNICLISVSPCERLFPVFDGLLVLKPIRHDPSEKFVQALLASITHNPKTSRGSHVQGMRLDLFEADGLIDFDWKWDRANDVDLHRVLSLAIDAPHSADCLD